MISVLIPNPNAADGQPVTLGGGSGGTDSAVFMSGVSDTPPAAPVDPTKYAQYVGPNGTLYVWTPATSAWISVVSA
jgi:hypothetical protein